MSEYSKKLERKDPFYKVRNIKITYTSDRGNLPTKKSLLDGFVEFESLLEEGLYQLLDHDPSCVDFESQPIEVPNQSQDRKGKKYDPDAWAKFSDGKQYIFDVKHQDFLDSLKENPDKAKKWEERINCIRKFCEQRGLCYEIITDNEIWNERHENVDFFEKNKVKPELFSKIKPQIDEILNDDNKLPRIELALIISKKCGFDVKQVIPVVDHLIFYDYFLLDFNTKINDDTILQLRLNQTSKIVPLYQYFSNLKNSKIIKNKNESICIKIDSKYPNFDKSNLREFYALPKGMQERIKFRIKALEIFERENVNTEKIKTYAQANGIFYSTLYRWKKNFEKLGWRGLIPNYKNAGRKKGFDQKVEDLIQKVIEEYYNIDSQPSILSSYRFFEVECSKQGITNIPKYDTFRNRIKEISNIEKTSTRCGKKVSRDKYKPLKGIYPFGKHPLDVIEFDHSPLDIYLADRYKRLPVGRPFLTIAIDIYSRMIYGYYLSFDPPNILAVGECFLTGILPKNELTEKFENINNWAIHGLPKNILLDNAKEFKSFAFFNFCKQYGIKMRFNPKKRPDLKPHVERIIRTINEAIRDENLPGYILPLSEKKKTQYDPEKKDLMTFDAFEKWLVKWIVDVYHKRPHKGIKLKEGIEISPSERYEQGLADVDGRTVGMPLIPADQFQLKFDLLPIQKRKLHREGVKLFNLAYYDDIILKLRAYQKSEKEKYIVRYDPRDIREVYLWNDKSNKYHILHLKHAYSQLKIDINDPLDKPLSLKELVKIKQVKPKGKLITPQELIKGLESRQQIIQDEINKSKIAKKARKRNEKIQLHKTKATSSQIRANANYKEENNSDEINNIENKREAYIPTISLTDTSYEILNKKSENYKPKILPISYWEDKKYRGLNND